MQQWRTYFVIALWLAFLARGLIHVVATPASTAGDEAANVAIALQGERGMNGAPAPSDAGPLFRELAAQIVARAGAEDLRSATVALRIFCLLIASVGVPLTALLAGRVCPEAGVLYAVPIVALAPNTSLFAARATEHALAWPLCVAVCILVVRGVQERSARPIAWAVALSTAGAWIDIALISALPACAAAAFWNIRGRGIRAAAALSWAALAPLLLALLPYRSSLLSLLEIAVSKTAHQTVAVFAAVADVPLLTQLTWAHLWSGGPELRALPAASYSRIVVILILIAAPLLIAALRRRSLRISLATITPLIVHGAAFLLGVWIAALAAWYQWGPAAMPSIGLSRWPLDLVRSLEAIAAALLLTAAIPLRWTVHGARLVLAALIGLDVLATALILLPSWEVTSLLERGWTIEALALVVFVLSVGTASIAAGGIREREDRARPATATMAARA